MESTAEGGDVPRPGFGGLDRYFDVAGLAARWPCLRAITYDAFRREAPRARIVALQLGLHLLEDLGRTGGGQLCTRLLQLRRWRPTTTRLELFDLRLRGLQLRPNVG